MNVKLLTSYPIMMSAETRPNKATVSWAESVLGFSSQNGRRVLTSDLAWWGALDARSFCNNCCLQWRSIISRHSGNTNLWLVKGLVVKPSYWLVLCLCQWLSHSAPSLRHLHPQCVHYWCKCVLIQYSFVLKANKRKIVSWVNYHSSINQ